MDPGRACRRAERGALPARGGGPLPRRRARASSISPSPRPARFAASPSRSRLARWRCGSPSTPSWPRRSPTSRCCRATRLARRRLRGRRARAGRRGRLHHALQLPDDQLRREDRPRARVRQHRRREAGAGRPARRRRALPHRRRRCCRPACVNFVVRRRVPALGEALVASPDVDMISFTGSTGGRAAASRRRRRARSSARCSSWAASRRRSSSPTPTARRRCAGATQVWTFHTGQICIAGTRLLVEASIYDEFTAALVASARAASRSAIRARRASSWGRWCRPRSAIASSSYIARGRRGGRDARLRRQAAGASRATGFYVEPTLFTQRAQRHDRRARGDLRAGASTAIPFRDEARGDRARQRLRLRPLRLRVDRRPARAALRVARALRTGTVQVNNGARHESRRAVRRLQALAASAATAGSTRSTRTAS